MNDEQRETYKAQFTEGVSFTLNMCKAFLLIDNEKEQIAELDSQLRILVDIDEQLGIARDFMMELFGDPSTNWGALTAGTANNYIAKTKKRGLASFLYSHMLAYYFENRTDDDRYFKAAQQAIESAATSKPKILNHLLLGAVECILSQDSDDGELCFDFVHDEKFMANLKRIMDTLQSLGVKFTGDMTEQWTGKDYESFWNYIYEKFDKDQGSDYKTIIEFLSPYGKTETTKIAARRCLVVY